MHDIFLYSALGSLILWSLFDLKQGDVATLCKITFAISFFGLLFSLFSIEDKLGNQVIHLALDLLMVSSGAFVFQKLKDNKIAIIMLSILFIYAIPKLHQLVLYPKVLKTTENLYDRGAELIIELDEGVTNAEIRAIEKKYNIRLRRAFFPEITEITSLDNYYYADLPDFLDVKEFSGSIITEADIIWSEPNEMLKIPEVQQSSQDLEMMRKNLVINDPMVSQQWSTNKLNYAELHQFLQSKNIKPTKTALVAVLDSGVDAAHEDLADNYVSVNAKYDKDTHYHGTHCAGIVAAVSHNKIGIASMVPSPEWLQVTSIRVMNSLGLGTQKATIGGIIEAADYGVDVISFSIGGVSSQSREKAYKDAVHYANQRGTIVVVAAGNNSSNAKYTTPANAQGVISVASVDQNMNKSFFSNTMEDIEMPIAAPGSDVLSLVPQNEYKANSGTSMAAPHVSALVGLMKSIQPNLDTETAYSILQETGYSSDNNLQTGKVINPTAAIKALLDRNPS
jgi:thermitase